ncbi:MAG: type II secretion system F family protein [Peptoniphilus sp.]|nr:type II secretion system F family protein [Peptoniphilus sp.]MDD7363860.1 type II secretion system F family protein [Bacillota bacterium]MDY6044301.1 type II secretion system F family protein [Peptoniphilus sp.]
MKFKYKAIDPSAAVVSGELVAETKEDAEFQLHAQKLRIVHMREARFFDRDLHIKRAISSKDLSILFSQLALMTEGGLDIVASLELIERRSKGFERKKLAEMMRSIERGKLLSEAAEDADCFPAFVPGMLKSGEASGRLPVIFRQLADYFKDEHEMKQTMTNALAYPVILMITSFIVLHIVLQTVLPVFTDVFDSQDAQLPGATRALIALSEHLKAYGFVYLACVSAAVLVLIFLKNYERTKIPFQKFIYYFPLSKPFHRDPFELRFLRTVKMQIDNGVDVLHIFRHAEASEPNAYIAERLRGAVDGLMTGESFARVMSKSRLFKDDHCAFIALGEESSALSEMFGVAIHLEEFEQKNRAERIAAYIEPVLIIIMAGIVGFIIFSIAIPMFDMVNQF